MESHIKNINTILREHGYGLVPGDERDRYSLYALNNPFFLVGELYDTSAFPEEESYQVIPAPSQDKIVTALFDDVQAKRKGVQCRILSSPKEVLPASLDDIVEYAPSRWEVGYELIKNMGASALVYAREKTSSTLHAVHDILRTGYYSVLFPYAPSHFFNKWDNLLGKYGCDNHTGWVIFLGGGSAGVASIIFHLYFISYHPLYILVPLTTNVAPVLYQKRGELCAKVTQKFEATKQKIIAEHKKKMCLLEATDAALSSGHCPVCREEPKNPLQCKHCQTPHCTDCWDYNGGCGIFACKKKDAEALPKPTPLSDYIPPQSQQIPKRM